jgi:hypothetical protein
MKPGVERSGTPGSLEYKEEEPAKESVGEKRVVIDSLGILQTFKVDLLTPRVVDSSKCALGSSFCVDSFD